MPPCLWIEFHMRTQAGLRSPCPYKCVCEALYADLSSKCAIKYFVITQQKKRGEDFKEMVLIYINKDKLSDDSFFEHPISSTPQYKSGRHQERPRYKKNRKQLVIKPSS